MPTTDSKLQFSQRLNQLLDQHNFPPKNMGRITLLSELFEITHKGAGNWLNGKAIPSRRMLKTIGEHFGVSVEWLIFGHQPDGALTAGNIDIPVISKEQILSFLEGKISDFNQYISVQDRIGAKAFVIDANSSGFELDFLLSNSAKLVFDPEFKAEDKRFALLKVDDVLLIKQLLEYNKGDFAVKIERSEGHSELKMLSESNSILAVLIEIRF